MSQDNIEHIRQLVWRRVFEGDLAAEKEIRARAARVGIWLDSTFNLYLAIAEGRVGGFTVPAINIRTLTFDTARLVFRVMKELKVGSVIFEIAKSEIGYTHQPIDEYAVVILGAALAEEYRGPLFVQADHFQVNAKKYFADNIQRDRELKELLALVWQALEAGVGNIDVDASTLVQLERPSLEEQQQHNCKITADLIKFIRDYRTKDVTVTIGGEVGEVGGKNSTPEEVETFISGVRKLLGRDYSHPDLSKISVQTGTSHGGVVGPDGKLVEVDIDFGVHERCSRKARELGLAGTVQHGASTLLQTTPELLGKFPEVGCIEIHLATEFQNIVYKHLPNPLKERIYQYCVENFKGKYEWKEGLSEEQGLYKTRKRALGPFKRELWDLPEEIKRPAMDELRDVFAYLFRSFRVAGTWRIVENLYSARR